VAGDEPVVVSRYFYVGQEDSQRHKGKVSAYLVERLNDEKVVAKITPIGLVKEATAENELNLFAIKNNLSAASEWKTNRKTKKIRLILGRNYDKGM
jgi:hypothetical protein